MTNDPPTSLRAHSGPPIGLGVPVSKRSPWSGLVALLLHLAILALILKVAPTRNLDFQESAGAGAGASGGGGGGGGRIQIVALPALDRPPPTPPAAVPVPVPVVPVPVPDPVVTEPDPVVSVPALDTIVAGGQTSVASGSGTGAGTGSGSGSGTGSGSGSGSGNGSGVGSGSGPGTGGRGGARAPEPRQLILPPADVPKAMRGVTVEVTFLVGPEGRVEGVELAPEPDDRGFAKKLEQVLRDYRFRPARDSAGRVIAGRFVVALTF